MDMERLSAVAIFSILSMVDSFRHVPTARYIEIRIRQTDPNWQIANETNKIENALKEVDEGYECQSVSKATALTYTDFEGGCYVWS